MLHNRLAQDSFTYDTPEEVIEQLVQRIAPVYRVPQVWPKGAPTLDALLPLMPPDGTVLLGRGIHRIHMKYLRPTMVLRGESENGSVFNWTNPDSFGNPDFLSRNPDSIEILLKTVDFINKTASDFLSCRRFVRRFHLQRRLSLRRTRHRLPCRLRRACTRRDGILTLTNDDFPLIFYWKKGRFRDRWASVPALSLISAPFAGRMRQSARTRCAISKEEFLISYIQESWFAPSGILISYWKILIL